MTLFPTDPTNAPFKLATIPQSQVPTDLLTHGPGWAQPQPGQWIQCTENATTGIEESWLVTQHIDGKQSWHCIVPDQPPTFWQRFWQRFGFGVDDYTPS